MNPLEILNLFLVLVALALIPSTSVALVVVRSCTAGFANGVAVTAGIVLGDLIFVALAVLGVTALAEVLGGFFLVLRYLAGAYLIWFGISLMRSKPRPVQAIQTDSQPSYWVSFFSGLFLTLGDIKAIFFYASLLPVFVDLRVINAFDIATIIALTLVAVGGVKIGYAYAASRAVSFAGGIKMTKGLQVAGGGLIVGAGTYLIVKA